MNKGLKNNNGSLSIQSLIGLFFVCVVFFSFFTWASNIFGIMHFLDYYIYDWLVWHNSPKASSDIVAVLIDNKSINGDKYNNGFGRWPWPRSIHSRLIKRLLDSGASVIGFDLFLLHKTNEAEDKAFYNAIKGSNGRVVIGYFHNYQGNLFVDDPDIPMGDVEFTRGGAGERQIIRSSFFRTFEREIKKPYPLSYELVRRKLGITEPVKWRKNIVTDGTINIQVERFKEADRKDLSLRFYLPFVNELPKNHREGTKGLTSVFNYVSYLDVITGNFPENFFKNKIVIVYPDFDIHDKFPVPGQSQMNGGEIHANAVQGLFLNQLISLNNFANNIILGIVFLASFLMLAGIKKSFLQSISLIVLGALVVVSQILIFKISFQWVKIALPLLAIPLNIIVVSTYEQLRERELLMKFVPQRIFNYLIGSKEIVKAGKITEEATILFSDIRGYTTISERMTPEELQDFMGKYHKAMMEVISRFGGEVMYYQGDAQMVAFRISEAYKDKAQDMSNEIANHAVRGIACGLMMQERLARLNEELAKEGGCAIQMGIGITTGKVAFGLVGEGHLAYTALGDVVNTAARLQGLSAELSAQVLMDQHTYDLAKNVALVIELETVKLKGKTVSIKPLKLTGWKGPNLLLEDL